MNYVYLCFIVCYCLYIIIKSRKTLHLFQLQKYNSKNRYFIWLKQDLSRYKNIDLLFIVIFVLGFFLDSNIVLALGGVFYLICAFLESTAQKNEQVKIPLVYTARVKRMCVTFAIIYLIPIVLIGLFYKNYLLIILFLLEVFNNLYIILANFINKPIEQLVNLYYKNKAINKLKSMTSLSTIGITGSYGKTSSKNILNDVLNLKYVSFKSPKNLNTPGGLMITINNHLDKFCEYFIAEMGACYVGDIKEICDLVNPKYGIITRIGVAHMASFKSQENIQKTKFELIESLPSDGIGILNGDDPLQLSYKLKNDCKIVWIGIDNKDVDVYADNIRLSYLGSTFDVHFKKDNKIVTFETKLLGYSNIYNILSSIALGYELGMSIEELQLGVKRVTPVEHRLELKRYTSDIWLIDDAYNSNPVGSKMAIDTLGMMPGKKIVVTPGMIEMGELEEKVNFEFGKQIAEVCDEVILVGKKKTKVIYDALIESKFDEKKIHVINDVKESFRLMEELKDGNTYVLLENDLPDLFNEV